VRFACIDVGSNTTRLLVADTVPGGLQDVLNERAFTLIGRSLGDARRIPSEKLEETAAVVAAQAERARELGADRIRAVATAARRRRSGALRTRASWSTRSSGRPGCRSRSCRARTRRAWHFGVRPAPPAS
jgi:hypothetical protein